MEILSWIGVSIGLFAGALIVTKKNNSVADKLLASWLFLLAIEFLTSALDYNQFGYPLMSNAFLLMNPAFFLYVKSLVVRKFKLRWIHLLHLAPYLVFEVAVYILQEPLEFHNFLRHEGTVFFRIPFGLASLISWGFYNLMSLAAVVRHRRNVENEFSNLEMSQLIGWVLFILISYTTICLVSFILGLMTILGAEQPYLPHVFSLIALLCLVFLLGFYGLRQGRIYDILDGPEDPEEGILEPKTAEYRKTYLNPDRKEAIRALLIKEFEVNLIYLNPDLNMDLLARTIQVPKHQITEVLNTVVGRNFFQFVNQYRVEAVKKMLQDDKNLYSIEAIGYDCGFSSKSAFFTTFKKLTGITPSQYRSK